MFDVYIFDPTVARSISGTLLSYYGLYYSPLFKAIVAFRDGMEHTEVAPFIRRRIGFGDLLEYRFPNDYAAIADSPPSPGEFVVDRRDHRGTLPDFDW